MQESDRRQLEASLRGAMRGEVRFDGGTRAIYATDSSNYRHVPLGVAYPADADDLVAAVACCQEASAPLLVRGGGTSLAGQGCNEAMVLDTSRHLNRILEIDPERRIARVQPGVVLDDLRAAAERHGLTFGPDPATHAWCTLGGMIGNNSCGTHGIYAGKTVDNVERLDVLTYRGTRLDLGAISVEELARRAEGHGELGRIHRELAQLGEASRALVNERFPTLRRRVSGYNLDELVHEGGPHLARALVGTESTCAVVVEATLTLVESPAHRRLVVLAFPDVLAAADSVPELLNLPLLGLEGIDDTLTRQMRQANLNVANLSLLPSGAGWLLAEVGADDPAEADALAQRAAGAHHQGEAVVFSEPADQAAVWRIRESGLGATARPPGQPANREGWEDAAVPPERLGEYLRGIERLWERHGYSGAWYGHFGEGCVHTRQPFDFSSPAGVANYRAYVESAAELCVSLGGSLSGEHGDGQARGELLEKMFGPELVGHFGRFKEIFDPDTKMNPGRVVHARPLDEDLHFGPHYREVSLGKTTFALSNDHGSLQKAAERCVGVGRCRQDKTGVMCPSYRATLDERHSTRGRAKLLVEMFQGDTTPASWNNEHVFEALELCLSCKGCVSDCPTHVDMATYKAEFLSHYYARKLRPLASYLLSLLPWLARPASAVPQVANALLGEHVLGRRARALSGITTTRPAPRFARRAARRAPALRQRKGAAGSVVLWLDTFSDDYLPSRAEAAIELLERLGDTVAIPERWACCGRPLYDSGMLTLARRTLRHVLDVLAPAIEAGTPVVVLEPSCLATFRDELPNLLPDDARATKLASLARSLAEHLVATDRGPHGRGLDQPPTVPARPVALHPHCHQRAVVGMSAEQRVLAGWGFAVQVLDAGCCGLAGSFGFHANHDAVSRTIAEAKFLPALRGLDADTPVVIDGFSCITQASQLDGRSGTTLAELLLNELKAAPRA